MIINKNFCKKAIKKGMTILKSPVDYCRGYAALNELVSSKKNDEVIFFLVTPIGSNVYGLASLDAYREENPGKKVVVIGSKENEQIIRSYCQIDRVILLEPESDQYRALICFANSTKLSAKGVRQGVLNVMPKVRTKAPGDPDTMRQQRLTVFHLREDAPITYHGIEKQPVTAISNFSEIKNRVVILNPYSNSMPYITLSLYEGICEKLLGGGYDVYTNLVGDQAPIRGSKTLRCSISELYSIACEIPLIVSARSGILDFLITSNVNMFVIYENVTKTSCYDSYRLSTWKCKGKVKEIYVGNKQALNGVQEKFCAFLNDLNM